MTISGKIIYLSFFLSVLSGSVIAQNTVSENKDSLTHSSNKRANRAALYSAIVPGSGQIVNKKYWKLPLIYGGAGVLIYFIKSNNTEYKKFKTALVYRNDNDPLTIDDYPRFTNEDLTVRKDYYRRNRDLSYVFAGVLYTLNIIDAYVDSQLLNFDVSDNLSIRSGGTINYLANGKSVPSLLFTINFK